MSLMITPRDRDQRWPLVAIGATAEAVAHRLNSLYGSMDVFFLPSGVKLVGDQPFVQSARGRYCVRACKQCFNDCNRKKPPKSVAYCPRSLCAKARPIVSFVWKLLRINACTLLCV